MWEWAAPQKMICLLSQSTKCLPGKRSLGHGSFSVKVCMLYFSPDSITLEFALKSEKEDLTSWASTLFAGFGQEEKQQNGDHLRKRHNLKSARSKSQVK